MSIELLEISKTIWIKGRQKKIFDNLNIRVDKGRRVGILGQKRSGKSTLLKIMCGTERSYEGRVVRCDRVSWPIPLSSFLVNYSTVATNIRFIARMYGVEAERFVRKVCDIGDLAEFANKPLADCPRTTKQRLAFAMGMSLESDFYLFDERIAPNDKQYKDKADEVVSALAAQAGVILATSAHKEAAAFCDSIYVLDSGQAIYYPDVEEGVEHFKTLLESSEGSQSDPDQPAEQPDLDGEVELGI